jgi:hypothetical protein
MELTAAAMIPRGAIHERNTRSCQLRSDRKAESATAAGRAMKIKTAKKARLLTLI